MHYFWLNNKKYPCCFSLGALQEITERFGDVEKIKQKINDKTMTNSESISMICDMAAILANSGCQYYNTKKLTNYENSPANAAGVFIPPKASDIEFIEPENIESMLKAVQACFDQQDKKKIYSKPKYYKNSKKKNRH